MDLEKKRFFDKELDYFCKFFCQYNEYDEVKMDTYGSIDAYCPECGEKFYEDYDEDIELNLCEHCQVKNFITQIMYNNNLQVGD